MANNSRQVDIFEKIFVQGSSTELKRDAIILKPCALYELRIHCESKLCRPRVNLQLRAPYRKEGCFIVDSQLYDYMKRPATRKRVKSLSLDNMQTDTKNTVQYCSRDGALWVAVEYEEPQQRLPSVDVDLPPIYWSSEAFLPRITMCRETLWENKYRYSCNVCNRPDQFVFTIECILLRENLLIKELKTC